MEHGCGWCQTQRRCERESGEPGIEETRRHRVFVEFESNRVGVEEWGGIIDGWEVSDVSGLWVHPKGTKEREGVEEGIRGLGVGVF